MRWAAVLRDARHVGAGSTYYVDDAEARALVVGKAARIMRDAAALELEAMERAGQRLPGDSVGASIEAYDWDAAAAAELHAQAEAAS